MDRSTRGLHKSIRSSLFLGLIGMLVVVALSSCGDEGGGEAVDLPPGAVAKVGGTLVTKQQMRELTEGVEPGDREQAPRRAILFEWLKREAEVDSQGLARLSRSSGEGAQAADRLQSTFFKLYWTLLHDRYPPRPTAAEVARHYREHSREFNHPEIRYMRVVATDSQEQADAAKAALDDGQSWDAVIRRHGTRKDDVVVASGTTGAGPGEMPSALEAPLFAAQVGTLNGPVKAEGTWFVFQLASIDRLPRQDLAEASPAIARTLQKRGQLQAIRTWDRHLLTRYRPMTVCAPDLRLPHCSNVPLDKADGASVLDF